MVAFCVMEDQADVDKDKGDVWLFRCHPTGVQEELWSERTCSAMRFFAQPSIVPILPIFSCSPTTTVTLQCNGSWRRMQPLPCGGLCLATWRSGSWDLIAMISTPCLLQSPLGLAQLSTANRSFDSLTREKECVHSPSARSHTPRATFWLLVGDRQSLYGYSTRGRRAYALGKRATSPIDHPFYNKLLQPSHPMHPANKVLTEDVYYMHLLFKARKRFDLTLPPHALGVCGGAWCARLSSDVYYKLKKLNWLRIPS